MFASSQFQSFRDKYNWAIRTIFSDIFGFFYWTLLLLLKFYFISKPENWYLPVIADLSFEFFSHLISIDEDVVDKTSTIGEVGGAMNKTHSSIFS